MSGLVIDGKKIPRDVEAEGGKAIEEYLAGKKPKPKKADKPKEG